MRNNQDKNDIINGKYLNKKQVADKLNLTTKTIENYIKSGKLTAYKIGGRVAILEKDLNELIKKM